MGQKMGNAPVYFTVAQVRFNPVLNLETYLPSIQEAMRSAGFPDFRRGELQQIVMPFGSVGEGAQAAPSVLKQSRFIFGNIEETASFVLEGNALAFQTTEYDIFETFSSVFLKGVGIVHDALRLSFFERIGLRFLDAVLPDANETVADYLFPEVLGLSQKLTGLSHSFTETLTVNDSVHTVSRVVIQNGKVGLPQDLAMLAPKINGKFTSYEGVHAVLDTDSFYEIRRAFNLKDIETIVFDQKKSIKKSFDATVKDHALTVWKAEGYEKC